MSKRRLSPFAELKEYVEGRLFDLSLELQANALAGESVNFDYVLGYRAALNEVYGVAYSIYSRTAYAERITMDERTEAYTERTKQKFKKG